MTVFAVMILLISVGCTQANEPDAPADKAVTFGAYVSNTADSRAAESNIHTLKQSGFGVFASLTWDEDFQDNPANGGFTPNYMYNRKVEWKGLSDRDSAWVYTPELFWPGKKKVSFFAYAPYSGNNNSPISLISDENHSGSPMITFLLDSDINKQTDLLYANALNLIDSPQVPLAFKHALSRISIRLSTGNTDSNTKLSVDQLSFKSTDLKTKGELNLGTGIWKNISGSSIGYTFTTDEQLNKSFLVIPPADMASIEFTTNYTITTVDPKLPAGSFKLSDVTTSPLSIKFEAGKHYIISLHITLQSVDVSANVIDWDDEYHTWDSDQTHHNVFD